MVEYADSKLKKSADKTFVCMCNGKIVFKAEGFYESVYIECLKCNKQIKLSKAEVEALG